jgi:hypothetical protein
MPRYTATGDVQAIMLMTMPGRCHISRSRFCFGSRRLGGFSFESYRLDSVVLDSVLLPSQLPVEVEQFGALRVRRFSGGHVRGFLGRRGERSYIRAHTSHTKARRNLIVAGFLISTVFMAPVLLIHDLTLIVPILLRLAMP